MATKIKACFISPNLYGQQMLSVRCTAIKPVGKKPFLTHNHVHRTVVHSGVLRIQVWVKVQDLQQKRFRDSQRNKMSPC